MTRKPTRRISDARILFVLNDPEEAKTLQAHFSRRYHFSSDNPLGKYHEVFSVDRGSVAAQVCRERQITVVIADTQLSDMNEGRLVELLRDRQGLDRSPSVIVLLVKSDELVGKSKIPGSSKLHYAPYQDGRLVYYFARPYEMEDLDRVISGFGPDGQPSHNPFTHFPAGKAIGEKLKSLIGRQDWVLVRIDVGDIDEKVSRLAEDYLAGVKVVRLLADTIEQVVDEHGSADDSIGHIGGGEFLVVTLPDSAMALSREMQTCFLKVVLPGCPQELVECIEAQFSIFTLNGSDGPFGSVREIVDRIKSLG